MSYVVVVGEYKPGIYEIDDDVTTLIRGYAILGNIPLTIIDTLIGNREIEEQKKVIDLICERGKLLDIRELKELPDFYIGVTDMRKRIEERGHIKAEKCEFAFKYEKRLSDGSKYRYLRCTIPTLTPTFSDLELRSLDLRCNVFELSSITTCLRRLFFEQLGAYIPLKAEYEDETLRFPREVEKKLDERDEMIIDPENI